MEMLFDFAPEISTASYIVASLLFIMSLAGLSKHETSKGGIVYGISGMVLALATTGLLTVSNGWGDPAAQLGLIFLLVGLVIGASIGLWRAKVVEMTGMPELIALLHSFVGLAAVFIGWNGALYDVGTLLDAQGKYADAEDCFRRSLEGRRRLLGDMDPETLVSLSAMASEVMSQDRLADAEPLCREVLRLAEAIHGKDDRTTDLAASNLGVLLQRAGRYSEAEPLLRRHLDRASARFGLGHPDTLKAMGN
ncbi:MAG: hypothetical protein EB103_05750, partial [Actinobacteria bacterium]|nr:hypothetical protein [Actinomycetota bacterium]